MNAPSYPLRIIAFDTNGEFHVHVWRFVDSMLCAQKAAALAAEGKAVLICEVKDVLNGGDEGMPIEPSRQRRRR